MPRGDHDDSDQGLGRADDARRAEFASAGAVPPDAGDGRGVPGRRTVTIRGQGSERYVPRRAGARRPSERRYERAGFQPDRTAMWAVLLGVMLILAAAASAHAATLHALTRLH